MAQGRWLRKVFETVVSLGPGGEQDYGPYAYFYGQTIRVITTGTPRHYVGIFDAPHYQQFRRPGFRAPFPLIAARVGGNSVETTATGTGQYYVVLRVSTLNIGVWPIRVVLEQG